MAARRRRTSGPARQRRHRRALVACTGYLSRAGWTIHNTRSKLVPVPEFPHLHLRPLDLVSPVFGNFNGFGQVANPLAFHAPHTSRSHNPEYRHTHAPTHPR